MKKVYLSKSAFIKGMQCHKALYLKKHHPELEDPVSETQQAIFDAGTDIGQLATGLFPGGIDLGDFIPKRMFENFRVTRKLIRERKTIYESGFSHDGLMCFMDILVPDDDGWKAYEVKGSTSVKEVYLWDAAFQFYVMKQSGLELTDLSIIYINNQYERIGELDIRELFSVESVIGQVRELQPEIEKRVGEMRSMLRSEDTPAIDIGLQCTDPYPCSFMGHCWKHIPEYSVFNISRLKQEQKFDLYRDGIIRIEDVPEGYALSSSQQIQVESEREGTSIINTEAIREYLNTLSYPIRFLDFETFNPAVPMFDHSRPYQQIPFQYSMHLQNKRGDEVHHYEFLASAAGDPRPPFAENLVRDAGQTGSIMVYNEAFEQTRLKELARDFPEYAEALSAISDRMTDLMEIFARKHYYTPGMRGSYSIKSVLPALVPEFGYDDLEIADGGTASLAFESLYGHGNADAVESIRQSLLEYCRMDTLAMVKILEKLEEKAGPVA